MTNLLAEAPTGRQALMSMLEEERVHDLDNWHERSFLYLYHCGEDVLQLTKDAAAMYFMADRMAPSAFPSIAKYEREIVESILSINGAGDEAGGSVTTGGTESIFFGMKTARDWARDRYPTISVPEVVAPATVHPAFNKAAHYLGMKLNRIPECEGDFRADVDAMREAINENTIMLAGSAPHFYQGVVDPVSELGELALARGLWLHVDACMGGIMGPLVRELGYPVPEFGFNVPGVVSMSADLHKYGFAPKGVSVILFRDAELQKYQGFVWEDEYEVYATPTFAASQPGGSVAAAWAVLKYLGKPGFLDIAERTMQAKRTIIDGIDAIPELELWGEPELSLLGFGSHALDIMAVADGMDERGWFTSRLGKPPSIHCRLTPAHEPVATRFVEDLKASVEEVRKGRTATGESRITYGSDP